MLRAVVHHEDDGNAAQVTLAYLDPTRESAKRTLPHVDLIQLELAKSSDGYWRINLPSQFLQAQGPPDDTTDENLDADLLNALPTTLAALHPPTPMPTAAAALHAVLASRQHDDPGALTSLIQPDADPAATRASCARATQLRWSLREPSTVHRPPSTVHCPLPTAHCPLPTVHRPPSTVHRPPSTVHRPPSTVHRPLPRASRQPRRAGCRRRHLPIVFRPRSGPAGAQNPVFY